MNSGDWRWTGGDPADEQINVLDELPAAVRNIEVKAADREIE